MGKIPHPIGDPRYIYVAERAARAMGLESARMLGRTWQELDLEPEYRSQFYGLLRLALTTGKNPVPEKKVGWGYRYEPDKFGISGLTPMPSLDVRPPRIAECPVHMEGIVHDVRPFGKNVSANAFEIHIVRLHVEESLLVGDGSRPRPYIDPVKWRPLIMNFCRFFGIGGEVHPSRLAESDFVKLVSRGSTPQPSAGSQQSQ